MVGRLAQPDDRKTWLCRAVKDVLHQLAPDRALGRGKVTWKIVPFRDGLEGLETDRSAVLGIFGLAGS